MPVMISADVEVAHNYGNQKLNSVELAKDKLRQLLVQEDGTLFSYCPDYHHSMAFAPIDLDQFSKEQSFRSRQKWITSSGWTSPNKRSTVQKRSHPKRLDSAAVEEMQIPLDELYDLENARFISREAFPWQNRKHDMDIWTPPSKFQSGHGNRLTDQTTHVSQEEHKKLLDQQMLQKWKAKVIVDDVRQHFHRCAMETELKQSGPKSANQVSRLRGLLKDCPVKYSLKKPPLGMREIPALGVVNYPGIDAACRQEGGGLACPSDDEAEEKCFNPGSYSKLRLSNPSNSVPAVNYNHKFFEEKKGQDFDTYYRDRGKVYTRRILPLQERELDKNRFRSCDWKRRLEEMERIQQRNCLITRSLVEKPLVFL